MRSDFRFILFFAQMLDAPRLAALVEQRIACSRRSGRASGWIGESDRPQTGRKPPADLSLAEAVPAVRVRRPGGPMCPMKRVNINDLWYYPGGVITCTS